MAGLAALLAVFVVTAGGSSGPSRDSSVAAGVGPSHLMPPKKSAENRVTPLPRSEPVRIRIPAIKVDANLVKLGLQDDGTMQVPADGGPAGWYTEGPTPGEAGPAVVTGHVDWKHSPGVFYHLRKLKPRDEVTVAREDGTTAVFRVTEVKQFSKSDFPTDLVYDDIDNAGLRLVTCGGEFDRDAHSYVDNIIVFADLVSHRNH